MNNNTTNNINSLRQKLKLIIIFAFFFLFFKQATLVKAETIVFQDDFSNGFEKWETVRDHFNMWSIINNQADVFIDTGSTIAELVPKDEYWNPEWKNIIYELDYKYLQGADSNISFGFQDTKNWYEIHFANGGYQLVRVKNGKVVWGKTGYGHIGNSHVTVTFNEGHITFKVNDTVLVDEQDTTFEGNYGKIGIKATAGSIYPTHAVYDNIVVKSLDDLETKLDLSPQKQTNPSWATQEYDSAHTWSSNIGINRWGCALSSMSMILNYHNINTMPNGEAVNPNTLNTWLNSQEDGYIGSGLLNWIAVTRLTNIINQQSNTPKLEYSRTDGSNLFTAKMEIENDKPAILQIPGHFLVANGVVDGSEWSETESDLNNDLYITDPAYNFEKFSQHNTTLLSTRMFQPSFTDLSYIHLNHNSSLTLNVTSEDGSPVSNLQTFTDYLTEFNVDNEENFIPETSPRIFISELEKPTDNIYFLHLSKDELSPSKLTIFAYNTNGELSNLTFNGLVNQAGVTLKLHYDSQGLSSLEKIVNFQTFIDDLDELLNRKEIQKHYAYQELLQLAQFANQASKTTTTRYTNALQITLDYYSNYLTENAHSLLTQRLIEINSLVE